ncbi:MAG: PTS sugar transporter subunit IIA [Deltaproteobacteria bacterium]|jgi:mannitol operon transcriptional antiterminator|nr:PTS sugar transporter subunit IIA [Deltaproteobacteria bacterium]
MSAENNLNIHNLNKEWNVTLRTLYEDLESINDLLLSKDLEEVVINHSGDVIYTGEINTAASLLSEVDLYEHRLSRKERVNIICIKLLISDDYTEITEIEKMLNMSRGSAISDLKAVREYFKKIKIDVATRANKGIMVVCPEKERRAAMLDILITDLKKYENSFENSPYQNIKDKVITIKAKLKKIENIIKETEKSYGIYFHNESFIKAMYYLLIAEIRMSRGNYLVSHEFKTNGNKTLATSLMNRMYIDFNLKIYDGEIRELEKFIDNLQYEEKKSDDEHILNIYNLTTNFLMNVSRELSLDLRDSGKYFDAIMNYIENMDKNDLTMFENQDIVNLLSDNHKKVLDAVSKHIGIVENHHHKTFSKNQIYDLTLHICATHQKLQHKQKVNIVFCKHDSTALSYYQAVIIENKFNADVKVARDSEEFWNIVDDSTDLIISNFPLNFPQKEVIVVERLLGEKDLLKIEKSVEKIKLKKIKRVENTQDPYSPVENIKDIIEDYLDVYDEKKNKDKEILSHENFDNLKNLYEMIKPENIRIDVPCANFLEALEQSALPLLENGTIKKSVVSSMIETYKNNGKIFVIGDGFAAPHADVDKSAISLIRLKNAVNFGHKDYDPVEFVCFLGINKYKFYLKAFYNLTRLAQMDDFKESLRRARSEDEINSVIEKFETALNRQRRAYL